jgi:hypothetical protein
MTPVPPARPRRWLTLGLGAYLLVGEPVRFAVVAAAALSRVLDHGLPAIALLLYRVVVTGVGLTAGRHLLTHGDPALARVFLVANAVAVALTLLTPYFPSNRVPGTKLPELLVIIALHAVAYAWLLRPAEATNSRE